MYQLERGPERAIQKGPEFVIRREEKLFPLPKHPITGMSVWRNGSSLSNGEVFNRPSRQNWGGGVQNHGLTSFFFNNFPEHFGMGDMW